MLVVMQENATDEQIQNVIDRMVALNFTGPPVDWSDAHRARRRRP